jgi:hypothetical protein
VAHFLKITLIAAVAITVTGAAGLAMALSSTVTPASAAAASASQTSATKLYHQAMATTVKWSVHYASDGTISQVPILESGDAGPTAGTQTVLVGTGDAADNATLIVIGDLTYIKGNVRALEDLTGLSPGQAATATGQWVQFSTDNATYAEVVAGVRSKDVAQEIELKGPYTLGPSRQLDGYKVDAIRGTQKLQGLKTMHAVMYVRATGKPEIVEEDTVNAQGTPNGTEHMIFSEWGESVRPKAPAASITIGNVNAT